jgi:Cu2+-exporting ATPase
VRHAAETLGIHEWRAGVTPADKIARIEELKRRGVKALMVGDGMNDAPALAPRTSRCRRSAPPI